MSDEKFEEFLQREAHAYNEPPVNVPRDEMFAAISAARAAGPKTEDRGPNMSPWRRSPHFTWIGMAATLVIGVAIGRYAMTSKAPPAPAITASRGDSSRGDSSRGDSSRGDARTPASSSDTAGGSYARAANTELARAEALLTAYGASGKDAGVDKQLSTWARDILANTRLLLDSPAADDPSRRRLLQDLELVLVQMVQRSPAAGAADERSHIDRSMERTQVLPRLRSALPAGRNNGI